MPNVPRSTSSVLRLRAFTPITLAPGVDRAGDLVSSCTSTSAHHAERVHALNEGLERHLLERRDDQQHHVGAVRAGLPHLIRRDDEVLAKDGDVHLGAHGVEVVEATAEAARPR